MSEDQIIKGLDAFFKSHGIDVSAESFIALSKKLERKTVEKGKTFCKNGKACNEIGILLRGIMCSYFESPNNSRQISRFFFLQNHHLLVSSFESFKNQTPSNETIEAVEESELLCISFENLQKLYHDYPDLNKLGRHLAEENYIRALQRIHNLQTMDSKELLIIFRKEKKFLFGRVDLKDIASYLGMTAKTLRELLNKKKI